MADKTQVLFLCTGNSARSQMAQAFLESLGGEDYDAHSAGSSPAAAVNPLAVKAMAELGINISDRQPKHLNVYLGQKFELVITVCDRARDACPVFPGGQRQLHWSFPDPAEAIGTEEERLQVFRQVGDDIGAHIHRFLEASSRPASINPDRPPHFNVKL